MLVRYAPRRARTPALQNVLCPRRILVLVAGVAGIGDFLCFGLAGRVELECVTGNTDVRYGLLDQRHMAGGTFAALAGRRMMRVRLDTRFLRAICCARHMAPLAHLVCWTL